MSRFGTSRLYCNYLEIRMCQLHWVDIRKKETQNDLLFRDKNNDLKPEPYIRRYSKLMKAQRHKNTLYLASSFIVLKHFNIYDFICN